MDEQIDGAEADHPLDYQPEPLSRLEIGYQRHDPTTLFGYLSRQDLQAVPPSGHSKHFVPATCELSCKSQSDP